MYKFKKNLVIAAAVSLMLFTGCGETADQSNPTTQAVTETVTEAQKEAKSEETSEETTEATTEKTTEATTEKTTEKTTEATTEKTEEATSEAPKDQAPDVDAVSVTKGNVWAEEDDNERYGYYLFETDNSGEYVDARTGERKQFTYAIEGGNISLTDSETSAVEIGNLMTEDRNIYLTKGTYLVALADQNADSFTVFAGNDIVEKAKKYVKETLGTEATDAASSIDKEGSCLIKVDGADNEEYAFSINTLTGTGELISAEPASVDFSN